jgi:hypothetical protein
MRIPTECLRQGSQKSINRRKKKVIEGFSRLANPEAIRSMADLLVTASAFGLLVFMGRNLVQTTSFQVCGFFAEL